MVYATRRREDHNTSDVTVGTFTIHSISYFVLIDIGSTHSYVASKVSEKLKIGVEDIVSDVTIVRLLGQSLVVNKIYRICLLEIQDEVLNYLLVSST